MLGTVLPQMWHSCAWHSSHHLQRPCPGITKPPLRTSLYCSRLWARAAHGALKVPGENTGRWGLSCDRGGLSPFPRQSATGAHSPLRGDKRPTPATERQLIAEQTRSQTAQGRAVRQQAGVRDPAPAFISSWATPGTLGHYPTLSLTLLSCQVGTLVFISFHRVVMRTKYSNYRVCKVLFSLTLQ